MAKLLSKPYWPGLIVQALLTKPCHQSGDARLAPLLDGQRTGRFDVDTFAGAEHHRASASPAAHTDTAIGDEDRGLGLGNVDGPSGAAYRGDRLRRQHLEGIAAGLLGHLDQQGL